MLYTTGAYRLFFDDFGEAELTEHVTINGAHLPFATDVSTSPARPDRRSCAARESSKTPAGPTRAQTKKACQCPTTGHTHTQKLPRAAQEKYQEAAIAEHDNWMRRGGLRPLTRKEARKVFSDEALAKRILKSRSAFRDKNKGHWRAPC